MPQHGTEASLSPAAGTSSAAACFAFNNHGRPLGQTKGYTKGNATCFEPGGGGGGGCGCGGGGADGAI